MKKKVQKAQFSDINKGMEDNKKMERNRDHLKVWEVDWASEGIIFQFLSAQYETPYKSPYLVPYVEAKLLMQKHYPNISMYEVVKKEFLEGCKMEMNKGLGATELEIAFDVEAVLERAQIVYQAHLESGVVQKKGELCNKFGRVDKNEIKAEIQRMQKKYVITPLEGEEKITKEEVKELREENKELKKELRTQDERFKEHIENIKRFMAEEFKKEGLKLNKRELNKGIKDNKKMILEDFKKEEEKRKRG